MTLSSDKINSAHTDSPCRDIVRAGAPMLLYRYELQILPASLCRLKNRCTECTI